MTALDYLVFWAAAAALFLLPGALLARRSRLLWDRISAGERVLPAFLLSAGVFGVVYVVALALRPTLDFATAAWLAITGALLLWNLLGDLGSRLRRGAGGPRLRAPTSPGDTRSSPRAAADRTRIPTTRIPTDGMDRAWVLVLPVLAAAWIAMLLQGGALGVVHDSLDFVAFVGRMLQTGRIDLASGAFEPSPDLAPDARRGTFHLAGALLCRASGVSAVDFWRAFPSFLVPLALWIFFATFRRVLASAEVALASLLFFVTATFFTGDHFINNLAYASRIGWVYSWVGLWAVALYLDRDRRDTTPPADWSPRLGPDPSGGRAAAALAAAAAPILLGVHILSAAQYLVALGAFCWGWALARREPRPVRRVLYALPLLGAAALAPLLYLKLARSYSAANPLFDHPQGLLYLFGDWAVLSPAYLWRWYDWPGLLGILATVPLLVRFRRSRAFAFLGFSTMVPFLVVLNPVAILVIEEAHAHSLLFRLLLIVPWFQVLGFYFVWGVEALRVPGRRAPAILFFVLAFLALALHFRDTARSWSAPAHTRTAWREAPEVLRAFEFLESATDRPRVVLTDPVTSYALPAYTRQYAMTPLHQHSSPSDARTLERIQDAQAMLSGTVGLDDTVELLRKWNVAFVLLNQTPGRYENHYYTAIHSSAFPAQREKFESRPELFERIYDAGGIAIFRYHDPGPRWQPESPSEEPRRVLTAEEADGVSRREIAERFGVSLYPGPALGGLELIALSPDTLEVPAGGAFVLDSFWRRTGEPIVLPVAVFVRMQTEFPHPLYNSPILGRAYSILDEERRGLTHRWGRSYEPLASSFPAYRWTPGAVYEDELYMPVPRHAAPGLYTVRALLIEIPFSPNYRLADLFSLRDALEGTPIATLRVLPAAATEDAVTAREEPGAIP